MSTAHVTTETQILCSVILFQNQLVSLNVVIVENVVFWSINPEQRYLNKFWSFTKLSIAIFFIPISSTLEWIDMQ